MAERRRSGGYFDRLVEQAGRPRPAGVHAPRQLAWGPPRPLIPPDDAPFGEAEPQPRVRATSRPHPAPRVEPGERARPPVAEPEPSVDPTPSPRPARRPRPTPPVGAAAARPTRTSRTTAPPPRTAAEAERATTATAPPTRPAASHPAAAIRLTAPPEQPAAVIAGPAVVAGGRPRTRTACGTLAAPPRRGTTPSPDVCRRARSNCPPPARAAPPAQPVSPSAPAPQPHREAVREPQVRIGTIEVTIAGPPAPPAPAFPPPVRPIVVAAPAPATRLSRPTVRLRTRAGLSRARPVDRHRHAAQDHHRRARRQPGVGRRRATVLGERLGPAPRRHRRATPTAS